MLRIWQLIAGEWKFEETKLPEVIADPPPCQYCGGPNPWAIVETFPGVKPFRMCSECLNKGDDTWWSGEEEWATFETVEELDKSKIPLHHSDKTSSSGCSPAWVIKGRRLGIGTFGFKRDIWLKAIDRRRG